MLGLCWRRQKCNGATALFVLAVCAACAVVLLLLSRLRDSTAELHTHAQHCREQQEALSAQLQVVYEHRSRLERTLQKERVEHKKTKEDFLLYKLEAQESLNKEKQDAMNRYSALSSQNNILKNQLGEMRTQLLSQQTTNGEQQLVQRKALEECKQMGVLRHTEDQDRIASLQDTVMKLREESKLLRKAHQDIHSQLLSAQVTILPLLSQSKQKTQLEIGLVGTRSTNQKDFLVNNMDKWPGEEGQEHQLDSLNRKNNYNQRPDKNFLLTNEKPSSNNWRGVMANEIKSTVPEEINEDKDFVERLDNGDLEIDSQGEEMAQGQGAIAQEPMEDGRIGETEDQLEEEEEEEEEGGNEEEY
ncbi:Golgi integral membrane protein 4-like isoform X3 [Conger conger]|uniref:Golgi integral membrane protein 4-like isoform X3 n=1 Tax=Conger conger TaxID=82655 RepID=UPI002A59E81E|nr:Golgi integral membrane protein 4-like isoform X3 [Conger conger]